MGLLELPLLHLLAQILKLLKHLRRQEGTCQRVFQHPLEIVLLLYDLDDERLLFWYHS